MIGDWVSYNRKPCHIIGIMPPKNVYIDNNFPLFAVLAERCDGIELTPEILNINGWTKRKYSSVFDKAGVCFSVGINSSKTELYVGETHGDDSAIFSFMHVHQLQHALRLIGLTELADNFKIE